MEIYFILIIYSGMGSHFIYFNRQFSGMDVKDAYQLFLSSITNQMRAPITAPSHIFKQSDIYTSNSELDSKRPKVEEELRKTIIIIDGLDHIEQEVFSWLPGQKVRQFDWLPMNKDMNPYSAVIVSLTSDTIRDELMTKHSQIATLNGSESHAVSTYTFYVPALSTADCKQIIHHVLHRASKTLTDDLIDIVISNSCTSNPLFLQLFLEELIQFGRFSTLPAKVNELASARSIEDLLEAILKRIEKNFAHINTILCSNLVASSMRLIASARDGIVPDTELRDLVGLANSVSNFVLLLATIVQSCYV